MRFRSFNIIIAICSVSWTLPLSLAIAAVWVSPFGGNFENPANWQGGIVPTMGLDAEFQLLETYEVIFSSDEFSEDLLVTGGNVTFVMQMGSVYSLSGSVVVDDSSLIVNGGQLNYFGGSINVLSNATLGGNATTFNGLGGQLTVNAGGQLNGTPTINDTVSNQGIVAPGNSPDTGRMTINGDYIQGTDATLDIELGGLIPVAQHDQLQVNGSAQLAGRLNIPFINGYEAQLNDTFTFFLIPLPGSTIIGQFDSISVPGLPSGLAAKIVYGATDVSIAFVAPLTVGFNSGNLMPGGNDWNDTDLWGGGTVPDGASVVNVLNQQNFDARIELTSTGPAGFSHRTTLGGTTNTMTLAVLNGADFTASERLNVNNRGVLDLETGGVVHSDLVKVNPGGQLVGTGVIDGDLQLGNTTGNLRATLSPGNSVGVITVTQDLTLTSNVDTVIEVFAANDFDEVIVLQEANLDGTLMIDVSGATGSLVGTSFEVLTADLGLNDTKFDDVETIEADNVNEIYLAPTYSDLAVTLTAYELGDMNRSGGALDGADVVEFAHALRDPVGYQEMWDVEGSDSGDIDGIDGFNFDDIVPFSELEGISLTAEEIFAVIQAYTPAVPEPTTGLLSLASTIVILAGTGRRSHSIYSIAA